MGLNYGLDGSKRKIDLALGVYSGVSMPPILEQGMPLV